MDKVRKYKIIKKVLIPILALAIFLLPISPSLNINREGHLAVGINKNEAEAFTTDDFKAVVTAGDTTSGYVSLDIKLSSTKSGAFLQYITEEYGDVTTGLQGNSGFQIQISDKNNFSSIIFNSPMSWARLGYNSELSGIGHKPTIGTINDTGDGTPIELNIPLGINEGIKPNIPYFAKFTMENSSGGIVNISNIEPFTVTGVDDSNHDTGGWTNKEDFDFGCINLTHFSMSGCVAAFVYVFYELSAMVAHVAGRFLDFLVYYSTSSDSYVSGFITKGWGAIRDVANIFFIIALLYIAIKTILSLNTTNNKKIIGTIVIVALLINFSLFFTQVIIDGSNILAKVFYNNIVSVGKDGKIIPAEAGGEKSISIGLVDKFNPQKIVSQDIYQKGGHGQFIFITILALAISLYAAYIFFTVGLLFVSRVVMLWLSMIFAPVAFASYTLPFDIPGLGHKEWWKQLLENAFLAPLFIFMLYIVVMFAGFLSEIVKYGNDKDFIQSVMGVVIPFVILMVLLMKAKGMAVKYAGEMGAAMQKAGAMVGGVALGAATGGAAMLGRQTIGRAAANISQSNKFRDWAANNGRFGKLASKTMTGVGAGSFDARGIKVAGKSLASTGLKVGKNVKTGGFAKGREESVKKEEEYANKNLDTSDYGMAELRSGKMSQGKKDHIVEQIKKSGGDFGVGKDKKPLNEQAFRAQLQGGLDKEEARKVADKMNVARRGDRADFLGSKRSMTSKIKGNKVRKDVKTIEKTRNLALTMAALATAQKATESGENKKASTDKPVSESKGPAASAGNVNVEGVHEK